MRLLQKLNVLFSDDCVSRYDAVKLTQHRPTTVLLFQLLSARDAAVMATCEQDVYLLQLFSCLACSRAGRFADDVGSNCGLLPRCSDGVYCDPLSGYNFGSRSACV